MGLFIIKARKCIGHLVAYVDDGVIGSGCVTIVEFITGDIWLCVRIPGQCNLGGPGVASGEKDGAYKERAE